MISYVTGDILGELSADADAIVIPVNCIGTMTRGLAQQCWGKGFPGPDGETWQTYAGPIAEYVKVCQGGHLHPGGILAYSLGRPGLPKSIIFAATMNDEHHPSKIEWIEECLQDIKKTCLKNGIGKLSIPLIGSGLGGLPAKQVGRAVQSVFKDEKFIICTVFVPIAMMKFTR